jgi:hypothetical protein
VAKRKKKQLPKDFETLLKTCGISELKNLFDTYDVNARAGYSKQTALAFSQCPDELARWLVEQGADLAAVDCFGNTPLHSRSSDWNGRIVVLLELGSDVNHGANMRGTPLHAAAGYHRTANVGLLVQHGADVNALNRESQTPLAYALQRCSNINLEDMAAIAELLLAAGARKTPEMKTSVAGIGANFEFHRAALNPEFLKATSAALDKLYKLFDVPPVPHRLMHDGTSPIVAREKDWQDKHQELWELLVPSSGAADTVQGEVIRIAGKIQGELDRNGWANWDLDYKQMADAFLVHIASGIPLAESSLTEAHDIVSSLKHKKGDACRLCRFAVNWVALNPTPMLLPRPDYKR